VVPVELIGFNVPLKLVPAALPCDS
jgi:hypothetical protein